MRLGAPPRIPLGRRIVEEKGSSIGLKILMRSLRYIRHTRTVTPQPFMTDASDLPHYTDLRDQLARLTADAPLEGGASPEVVDAWRVYVHDLPDELLDEELVRLLELVHHKL